jgi:hypothetical protein
MTKVITRRRACALLALKTGKYLGNIASLPHDE